MDASDRALIDAYAAYPFEVDDGRRLAALATVAGNDTRAYQRLNRLIDDPAAWEHDPVTMGLLRRRRERRTRARGRSRQLIG
jgi:hypothetical protein